MIKAVHQATTVKPGGVIELAPTDIPVGSTVEIFVVVTNEAAQAATLNQDQKWERFYAVLGAWKNDDEIDQIFTEIDKERHLDRGREVSIFDE